MVILKDDLDVCNAYTVQMLKKYVACVWHNLCILTDDDILSFIDMDEAEDCNRYPNIYGNAARGEQRRNALVNVF